MAGWAYLQLTFFTDPTPVSWILRGSGPSTALTSAPAKHNLVLFPAMSSSAGFVKACLENAGHR
jgi:hypothetical protein